VSEALKEVHKKTWGESNPAQNDILQRLILMYKTPARWDKAVIHLREQGLIEDALPDIGKLIPAVQADIEKECVDEIKDVLYRWAIPHVKRGVTGGLPEWYKKKLLEKQFPGGVPDGTVAA
jgi:tRNA uridine 5-carbamoylmethylation protein Kti12